MKSKLLQLVKANSDDLCLFTTSHLSAIDRALFAIYFDVTTTTGKNHFVFAHNALVPSYAHQRLTDQGVLFETAILGPQGFVKAETLAETIQARTAFVSVPAADRWTGVIHPELKEIASLCQDRGIVLHLDISALLGTIDFNFSESGASLATFEGGRGLGGAIYQLKLNLGFDDEIHPEIFQAFAVKMQRTPSVTHTAILKTDFEEQVTATIDGTEVLYVDELRLPQVTAIKFQHVNNELLAFHLAQKGIACSVIDSALSFTFDDTVDEQLLPTLQQISSQFKVAP